MEKATITDETVAAFRDAWQKAGNGSISAAKAKRRLETAVESGCLLLSECANCPKCRACPVLDTAEAGA